MNYKKILLMTISVLFVLPILLLGLRFLIGGPEDSWICSNGQWVKHGNPSAAKPISGCGEQNNQNATSTQNSDPANSTYTIDGKKISLTNGQYSDNAAGSIKIFEANTKGDVNYDNLDDTVVILVNDSKGSGIFYYVALAIKNSAGYEGTDAILLGDRIAPQNTEIRGGIIIVNYADRKTGEPMTTAPSAGVSRYFVYEENIFKEVFYKNDLIEVDTPAPASYVSSPLTISGKARGNWFFEAVFPVTLTDWDGLIIGQGQAQAQGEWMTENFVPFTATITFKEPVSQVSNRGALTLKKDNPSGLPQNDNSLEIPVFFSK
jgi:hypothetical protein